MAVVTETAGDSRQRALQQELRELVDVVGPAPLVDLLLERSFQLNATDIHLDPTPTGLRIRLRVDGLLHDIIELPGEITSQIISRLKLMAGMNITEKRLSQDGHISGATLRASRDIRVGSGPTIHGERLVLRLMPDETVFTKVEDLGLNANQLQLINGALKKPYGLLLCVGPVGSGKSTTTYALLDQLNSPHRSIVTLEDPVERRIESINQIQIDPRINFNFADALRGVLRQDPDVVMVGEIRDAETAHIACRAGLTGVRVLSTLHANDTAATIDVLREFGIPPMFIADAVNCIVSQRLVRKVCTHSREIYHPDEAECRYLDISPDFADTVDLVRGVPAPVNFGTGYSGRSAVFEVLPIDARLRHAILSETPVTQLRQIAIDEGLITLEKAGLQKVREGITTLDEVHRVLLTSII